MGARYDPSIDMWQPIASANAPSVNMHHSAIWTDSEMIVWGGASDGPLLYTGGRYSPTTDTWRPISSINEPSPRGGHSAVWTGTEMIVWGGFDLITGRDLNDGASFDPVTDTWRPLTTDGAPSARMHHSAIWTGSEMIVWGGGASHVLGFTNTGGRYNPATASWRPMATSGAPAERFDHRAVWTGAEMIVWGGVTSGDLASPATNTGGRYDPATDSWHPTPIDGAPSAGRGRTAVWSGVDMFIWGGGDVAHDVDPGRRYDPSTNRWSAFVSSDGFLPRRAGHTAVWTGSSMIVWGGNSPGTGERITP